ARGMLPREVARAVREPAEDVEAIRKARERVHPRTDPRVIERGGDADDRLELFGVVARRAARAELAGELERHRAAAGEADEDDTRHRRVRREVVGDDPEVAREAGVIERGRVRDALAGAAKIEPNDEIAGAMKRDRGADDVARLARAADAMNDDDER